ncbi:MAG TPA: CDP-diacylglycerol--glycerol-3-phosphate 3-phosphatidyltransferase [Candidatus Omnitrophica bacterium]|nr:CDP-diacylglycerol--glycerol-3-phosphate 3-phosphatidyltransferase [Candidatus Omnitrophota bacterium]
MTFANKITLFRIISIPFFIACLIFYTPEKYFLKYYALGIFLLAIVSDAVDGYIARTKRQKTKAGAILDPLADKALLITAFIFTYHISKAYFSVILPLWVLLVVISRDAIILIGSGIILTVRQGAQIKPTWWGKLTTFFQMTTIIAILLELGFSPILWQIASAFTVISGIDYARKGINTINSLDHARNNNIKASSGPIN